MRQGWMALALVAALTLPCSAFGPLLVGTAGAAKSAESGVAAKKSGATMRQFTGYVTALDGSKLTVEKRGKKPQSRTFTKHADLKTTGEVGKEARVTVYYRDEGGKAVAHRVVVKDENGSKSRG
jgi:hypothetical protein